MQKALNLLLVVIFTVTGPVWSEQTASPNNASQKAETGVFDRDKLSESQICLLDICGGPPKNLIDDVINRIEINRSDETFKNKYIALSRELHLAFHQYLTDRERKLVNALKMAKEDAQIDEELAIIVAQNTKEINENKALTDKIKWRDDGNPDEQQSLRNLAASGLLTNRAKEVTAFFKHVSEIEKRRPNVLKEDYAFYRQTHSSREIQNELLIVSTSIQTNRDELAKKLGLSQEITHRDGNEWNRLKARIQNGSFSAQDVEDLDKFYKNSFIWTPLTYEKQANVVYARTMPVKSLVNGFDLNSFREQLQEIKDYQMADADPQSVLAEIEREIKEDCSASTTFVDMYFPDEKQAQLLLQNEKQWRKEFVNKVSNLVSNESAQQIKTYFAKVKVKGAQTKSEWLRETTSHVFNYRESKQTDNISTNSLSRQLSTVRTLDEDFPRDPDLQTICRKNRQYPNPWDDEAHYKEPKVHFGALSATNPRVGRTSAMHEYSHILDGFMNDHNKLSKTSLGWINDKRSCVQKTRGVETKYLKEDFADMLGAALSNDNTNLFCLFLKSYDDNSVTLINPNVYDNHSSVFYRALHLSSTTGEFLSLALRH